MIAPAHKSGLRSIVAVVLFAHLALSPFLFSIQTLDNFEFPKVLLLMLVVLVVGALGVATWVGERRGVSPPWTLGFLRDPLNAGILLFVVSALLSSFLSVSPRTSCHGAQDSFAGFFTILASAGLFFGVRWAFQDTEQGRSLLMAPVLGVAAVCCFGILQLFHVDPLSWERVSAFDSFSRPFAALGHANHLGAYLVMALPLLLWCIVHRARRGGRFGRSVLLVLCVLSCVLIVATLSRGAWLALAIVGIALTAVRFSGYRLWTSFRMRVAIAGTMSGLVFATVMVFVFLRDQPALAHVQKRVEGFLKPAGRQHIWANSWRLFLDRPLIGHGPETLQLVYGKYRTPESWEVEPHTTPTRAHNEVLHILVTQGLLGLTALFLILVGLCQSAVRAWRQVGSEKRPLLLAMIVGMFGYAVTLLFSFSVVGCGTLFVTMAGLVSAWGRPGSAHVENVRPQWLWPRWFRVAVIVTAAGSFMMFGANVLGSGVMTGGGTLLALGCMAVACAAAAYAVWVGHSCPTLESRTGMSVSQQNAAAFPPWIRHAVSCGLVVMVLFLAGRFIVEPYRASKACHDGETLESVDPSRAVERYLRAVELEPGNDVYWSKCATAWQRQVDRAGGRSERIECLRNACDCARRAAELVPASSKYNDELARNLALLDLTNGGDSHEAIAAFDAAVALDENNMDTLLHAGRNALALEELSAAGRYITLATERYPEFVGFKVERGLLLLRRGERREGMQLLILAAASCWVRDADLQQDSLVMAVEDLLHLKLYADAEYLAALSLQLFGDNASLHLGLAGARVMQGHYAGAQQEYERVLKLQPDHGVAREALARLRQLKVPPRHAL